MVASFRWGVSAYLSVRLVKSFTLNFASKGFNDRDDVAAHMLKDGEYVVGVVVVGDFVLSPRDGLVGRIRFCSFRVSPRRSPQVRRGDTFCIVTFEDVSALVSPVWSANCCDEHTSSRRGEELCMSTSTQERCLKAADLRGEQLSNLERPCLR